MLLPSTPHPYNSHDDERERWIIETINGFVKLMENLNHIKRASPVTSSFSSWGSKRELVREWSCDVLLFTCMSFKRSFYSQFHILLRFAYSHIVLCEILRHKNFTVINFTNINMMDDSTHVGMWCDILQSIFLKVEFMK